MKHSAALVKEFTNIVIATSTEMDRVDIVAVWERVHAATRNRTSAHFWGSSESELSQVDERYSLHGNHTSMYFWGSSKSEIPQVDKRCSPQAGHTVWPNKAIVKTGIKSGGTQKPLLQRQLEF